MTNEKQIPKKPIIIQKKYCSQMVCPNCNSYLISKVETSWFAGSLHKCCPKCGQRLNWSKK